MWIEIFGIPIETLPVVGVVQAFEFLRDQVINIVRSEAVRRDHDHRAGLRGMNMAACRSKAEPKSEVIRS